MVHPDAPRMAVSLVRAIILLSLPKAPPFTRVKQEPRFDWDAPVRARALLTAVGVAAVSGA
jgi:hypothetical protein